MENDRPNSIWLRKAAAALGAPGTPQQRAGHGFENNIRQNMNDQFTPEKRDEALAREVIQNILRAMPSKFQRLLFEEALKLQRVYRKRREAILKTL